MRSLRRTGIGIVAGLTMFTACPQSNAWAALEVSNTFSLRDHVGPNTVGSIPGDRLVFGAVDVTPSGPPTEVTATQGQTTIRLSFIPQALFPNQYAASLPFDPSLTGSWTLSATRPRIAGGSVGWHVLAALRRCEKDHDGASGATRS